MPLWFIVYVSVVPLLFAILLLHFQFRPQHIYQIAFLCACGIGAAFALLHDQLRRGSIPFEAFLGIIALYSVFLWVLLCEMLLHGLAVTLTALRGPNWAKEMDYVYLGVGGIGVIASIGKLKAVGLDYDGIELAGPFLLSTAIVVRAIKTRVEINKWNESSPT